ncbi:hypothetical protein OPT61_g9554 [Boeremia exigua]|uniref:Uncharacterized protein n=1 Tax=Boeremia exigua TaxID=749465 RepID=A0ACC2HUM2_9PLEO|nr:hypothetical protein OPT61_g9554 [Boeremia exigua]
MLGCTLYRLGRYNEAEVPLRQAVLGHEKTLGKGAENTLAKTLLEHAAEGHREGLGEGDQGAIENLYWLGRTLCKLGKQAQAGKLLEQAAGRRKVSFGEDDEYTLNNLYRLRRAVTGYEKSNVTGTTSEQVTSNGQTVLNTANTSKPLTVNPVTESAAGLTLSASDTASQSTEQLGHLFATRDASNEIYTDLEISQISILLKNICPPWSQSPRTYIILRVIGQLGSFNDLLHVGFTDHWLPATERSLPEILSQSSRAAFVSAQHLVLTKSVSVEKGQHCHFDHGEPLPFTSNGILGDGGFGVIDHVTSTISLNEFARKRVRRSAAFRGPRSRNIKQFIAEIEMLKRLRHRHIVELVGSYTDSRCIALLMLPIAEMDLSKYLVLATVSKHPELRSFFGCLASALDYLHEEKIRHKDIKLSNILVSYGVVLFADFGLSLDFEDASGSTTTGNVDGLTKRYCAPEVAAEESRNTRSDIWSLGVVYIEMLVVLKGSTVADMNTFFEETGSQHVYIRTNIEALPIYMAHLRSLGQASDNRALVWIQQMLSLDQQARPTASSLLSWIHADTDPVDEDEGTSFCGTCCSSHEEVFSDLGD